VVGAAVDVAHFGVDATGAALSWQQDAAAVPLDIDPDTAPIALPPMPQAPPQMPMPDFGAMQPPGPPAQGYQLPF
jgi:hypothetical protein